MIFARTEKGLIEEYPLYESDLLYRFPNLVPEGQSINETTVLPENYVVVEPDPEVFKDWQYSYEETDPIQIDGRWQQQHIKTLHNETYRENITNAKMIDVRNERNKQLADSDWTQLVDSPLDDDQKSAWRNYRQALRNLTDQQQFPWIVTWPSKPSV